MIQQLLERSLTNEVDVRRPTAIFWRENSPQTSRIVFFFGAKYRGKMVKVRKINLSCFILRTHVLRMAGRLKFLAELRLVINQTLPERAALTLLKSRMSQKRIG